MKIKLAILERDQSYLQRFISVFSTKYADKFQIYSFTDEEVAYSTLNDTKIDVLVASDVFEIDIKRVPRRCGFAYLVDSLDVETVNNQRAVCKFQKVDLIYKQILSIYSENAGNVAGLKLGDDTAQIVAFESVSGGCGGSTIAAACALHFAAQGKKTLYLNLEKFGSADSFFLLKVNSILAVESFTREKVGESGTLQAISKILDFYNTIRGTSVGTGITDSYRSLGKVSKKVVILIP